MIPAFPSRQAALCDPLLPRDHVFPEGSVHPHVLLIMPADPPRAYFSEEGSRGLKDMLNSKACLPNGAVDTVLAR